MGEISFDRLCGALWRRVGGLPHAISWIGCSRVSKENKVRLRENEDKHLGERCFIIGNGPSLKNMDLRLLQNEITFGLNRIYLLFEKMPFVPTYYVCVNELVLEQFAQEIKELSMPKFLNWNRRSYFNANDPSTNFINLSLALRDRFNGNIAKPLSSGGTVTYVAIQLAYIMGFSEIILIGVDHSFKDKGTPNKTEVRKSKIDANHFHPDYFPKGSKWQLPDLLRSELAYTVARNKIEADGKSILDATEGGKLTVFKKVLFRDLFDEN